MGAKALELGPRQYSNGDEGEKPNGFVGRVGGAANKPKNLWPQRQCIGENGQDYFAAHGYCW